MTPEIAERLVHAGESFVNAVWVFGWLFLLFKDMSCDHKK